MLIEDWGRGVQMNCTMAELMQPNHNLPVSFELFPQGIQFSVIGGRMDGCL